MHTSRRGATPKRSLPTSRRSMRTRITGGPASTLKRWKPRGCAEASGRLVRAAQAFDFAADDQRDDRTDQQARGQEGQSRLEAAGVVLKPAYRERPDEAAEVADRVDERNTARRGDAGQIAG